jgi:alpha-N-acetylglucosaminidase
MKNLLLLLLLFLSATHADSIKLQSKVTLSDQLKAVEELVGRVLPAHKKSFKFEKLAATTEGKDSFELEGLTIRATSGVAAASGLHYYLRHVAKSSIHWGRNRTGFNVDHLPAKLPPVKKRVRKITGQSFRYYFNAVTYGYSSAW